MFTHHFYLFLDISIYIHFYFSFCLFVFILVLRIIWSIVTILLVVVTLSIHIIIPPIWIFITIFFASTLLKDLPLWNDPLLDSELLFTCSFVCKACSSDLPSSLFSIFYSWACKDHISSSTIKSSKSFDSWIVTTIWSNSKSKDLKIFFITWKSSMFSSFLLIPCTTEITSVK